MYQNVSIHSPAPWPLKVFPVPLDDEYGRSKHSCVCLTVHRWKSFSAGQYLEGGFGFIRCAPSIVLDAAKWLSEGVAGPHSERSVNFW